MEINANFEETREKYPEVSQMHSVREDHLPAIEQEQSTEPQRPIEEVVKELLSNEQVKANALANANDIKKKCKGWFTVQQLAQKLMLKPEPVLDMLNLLCLFQMAYRKEHRGELRYKIILNLDDKLKIKQEELQEAEAVVEKLKSEIRFLCENIAASTKENL